MREHSRRRSIERALPEMLELISAELGAGLGLEQAFADVAKSRNDEAGKLLDLALERAQSYLIQCCSGTFCYRDKEFNGSACRKSARCCA